MRGNLHGDFRGDLHDLICAHTTYNRSSSLSFPSYCQMITGDATGDAIGDAIGVVIGVVIGTPTGDPGAW